jgi:hypothetical protein
MAFAAAPASAGSGWTSIGSAKLDGAAASATAKLRWNGDYRQLLVCADGGAVKLSQATLRFADGSAKPVRLRARLADGSCLAEMSVPKGRGVESVDFAYDPASLAGAATRITLAAR